MANADRLKERIANLDTLERGGKLKPETAQGLRQQALDILGQIGGQAPDIQTDEVVGKLKSMELRPFLGLRGVNKREELEPSVADETRSFGEKKGLPEAKKGLSPTSPPVVPQRSSLDQRVDRENAILASILAKARYADTLAKPGPGMIKPTDMSQMFGIDIPAPPGRLSMGIPRDALTDDEMEFLMDRNSRLAGGV